MSVLKLKKKCYFVGLLHNSFLSKLISALSGHRLSTIYSTLFAYRSLTRVEFPKCAYDPISPI